MRKHLLLVIICLLIPFAAHAQKRAFTIEDLYRIKSISDVHVSPDGRSVIYAVTTSDLPRAKRVTHIWTMNVDGQGGRQITSGDKEKTLLHSRPTEDGLRTSTRKMGAHRSILCQPQEGPPGS